MSATYCIENEYLRVNISQLGAELVSIWSKTRSEELLWQGEEWKGRAPILFPIVGNLPKGQYKAKGQIYELPRHGFARNSLFELRDSCPDSLTLGLQDSEQSRFNYPYAFDLSVTYRLEENSVSVFFSVANNEEDELLFSLGFHPAFSASDDLNLIFENPPNSYFYGNQGFVDFLSQPRIDMNTSLPLSKVDFSRGAIYMRDTKSQQITLKDGTRELGISLPDVPYVVVWKKPGSEFICVEPCFGITSPSDDDVLSLTEKPGVVRLESGENFTTMSEIKVM